MRLIDADELMKLCDIMVEKYNIQQSTWSQFKAMVECMPTIDAVQVVRCKDCKWYRYCNLPFSGDEFCSDGERKEEQ